MWYHNKISVVVLVLSISLVPWFNLGLQTFAQTNESVMVLITDAIEDLQNGDTNAALTHSNLALQELSSSANASDSVRILLDDVIQDIQDGDTNAALTHLDLVNKQLSRSSAEPVQDITDVVQPLITLVPWDSSQYGIKIQYPSTWEISEFTDANITTVASFHPPQNGSESLEQFYIEILELPSPGVILIETIQPTVDNLKSSLDDFRLIESKSTTLAGLPAHQIVYTKMGGNLVQMKDLQIWTVKETKNTTCIIPHLPLTLQNHLGTYKG